MYKDKLAEAKDIDVFDKALKEILKKTFDDIFIESSTLKSPLIYCHFAKGIGEPKYMPVTSWDALVKLLMDALKVTVSWHDLYLIINCFRATMSSIQSWTLSSLRMQCLMCAASIESLSALVGMHFSSESGEVESSLSLGWLHTSPPWKCFRLSSKKYSYV